MLYVYATKNSLKVYSTKSGTTLGYFNTALLVAEIKKKKKINIRKQKT